MYAKERPDLLIAVLSRSMASGTELVEAVPALQGTPFPLRPTEFSVYAYLTACSPLPAPQ